MQGHFVGAMAASLTLLTFALICKFGDRSANALRWILSAGTGVALFALGGLAGLHQCDQGTPIRLAALFGCLMFASVGFIRPRRLLIFWGFGLFFAGIMLCYYTANLYHRDLFTGNREFSSGFYWHSFLTEVYERKAVSSFGIERGRTADP